MLAYRCLLLLLVMDLCGGSGFLEQPRLSKMAWLVLWRLLVERPGFSEAWTSSCGWGPTVRGDLIKKEFRFLLVALDGSMAHRPCPGFHRHTRVEGSRTKSTSQYVPGLCRGLAAMILKGVRLQRQRD